jgi:hypothetical protein
LVQISLSDKLFLFITYLSKYRLAKYKLLSVRGLKSGSFGFAEGSACEYWLTRCPLVISFLCLCSPVKMVYFFYLCYVVRFLVVVSFLRLLVTLRGLAFVRDFRAQNCQPSTKAKLENRT